MATVIFINRTDLVRNSIIDGNVDTDPDYVLPDVNSSNNKWKSADGTASVEILRDYVGDYSSTTFPMPVTIAEVNSVLEL